MSVMPLPSQALANKLGLESIDVEGLDAKAVQMRKVEEYLIKPNNAASDRWEAEIDKWEEERPKREAERAEREAEMAKPFSQLTRAMTRILTGG